MNMQDCVFESIVGKCKWCDKAPFPPYSFGLCNSTADIFVGGRYEFADGADLNAFLIKISELPEYAHFVITCDGLSVLAYIRQPADCIQSFLHTVSQASKYNFLYEQSGATQTRILAGILHNLDERGTSFGIGYIPAESYGEQYIFDGNKRCTPRGSYIALPNIKKLQLEFNGIIRFEWNREDVELFLAMGIARFPMFMCTRRAEKTKEIIEYIQPL